MKELFANANVGITGLILFFTIFCAIVLWTMRPSAKLDYKKHGEIPLSENEQND